MTVQELIDALQGLPYPVDTKVRLGIEILIGDDDYWEPTEITEVHLIRATGYVECSVDMRDAAARSLKR